MGSPLCDTGDMPRELSSYHRRVAAANRTTILDAATALFLEHGYDRTSLARVAERAGVSKATLFKQFPTKAELFEAMVLAAAGSPDGAFEEPPSGDFRADLTALGLAYVELLNRPGMTELIRAVIAESSRFPELRERVFDFGTLPLFAAVRRCFVAASAAGDAVVEDPDTASAQFLGMISTVVFWPRLIHGGWTQSDAEMRGVVHEAVLTIVARYGARAG